MFILRGQRKIRIKRYTETQQCCPNCKTFDLQVDVYKDYFHLFFIPFFPTGVKSSSMYCYHCSSFVRIDSLQNEYEKKTRIPFWLYSGLILVGCLIVSIVVAVNINEKEERTFVQKPHVGDVYTIREDNDGKIRYYFLKISSIQGDSVFTLHSNLEYNKYIRSPQSKDFFVEDEELAFTKAELLQMLDKGEINSVKR